MHVELVLVVEVFLLDERIDKDCPAVDLVVWNVELDGRRFRAAGDRSGRQAAVLIVKTMKSQANLPQVVAALHAAGRLAGRLHRRQQQRNQYANDGDLDEQIVERETAPRASERQTNHE